MAATNRSRERVNSQREQALRKALSYLYYYKDGHSTSIITNSVKKLKVNKCYLSNYCYLLGAQWQDVESFHRG